MTEPHHCTHYADHLWRGSVEILENVRLARETYRVRLACPEIARRIVPGQFLMLRMPGSNDPLLGRPLALYDVVEGDCPDFRSDENGTVPLTAGKAMALDIVYLTVGKMTRRLAGLPQGATLDIWGPLGNGFPPTPTEHLLMVAGGIGQTPMLALAREYLGLRTYGDPARQVPRAGKVTLCYGCRAAEYLAGVEDFRRMGVEICVATEDGSSGHRGLVTDLIAPAAQAAGAGACRIVACGPEPMLARTAEVARQLGLPCQVSLESPMACGIGICFSCVAKVRDGSGHWDYRRTCVEGPIFEADEVEFS